MEVHEAPGGVLEVVIRTIDEDELESLRETPAARRSGLIEHPTQGAEMTNRDIEKVYSTSEFVAKLRRLADSLETNTKFEIQVAGERIYVPARAEFTVEHERSDDHEEIEFQIKWSSKD